MAFVQHWRVKDFFSNLNAFLYIFLSHLFHFSITVESSLIHQPHTLLCHTLSSLQTSPDAAFSPAVWILFLFHLVKSFSTLSCNDKAHICISSLALDQPSASLPTALLHMLCARPTNQGLLAGHSLAVSSRCLPCFSQHLDYLTIPTLPNPANPCLYLDLFSVTINRKHGNLKLLF